MVDIFDVAKKAKVSVPTVSRVINNKEYVSEKTKIAVQKAIEELNYSPSIIARGMRNISLKYIGLILPDITQPFYPNLIKGIEDYLMEKEFNAVITSIDSKFSRIEYYLDIFKKRKIDGIIYSALNGKEEEKKILSKFLESSKIPIVFVDRHIPDLNCSYVINDNFAGAYEATDYLIKKGHKKIGIVNFLSDLTIIKERIRGYYKVLEDNNIKIDQSLIYNVDELSLNNGYELAKKIFIKKKELTSIFCLSDIIALGILKYVYENKINIPEEVSLIGFDDIDFAAISNPPLTTVHQKKYAMGKEAAKIIVGMVINKKESKIKKILKPYLVLRNTTT